MVKFEELELDLISIEADATLLEALKAISAGRIGMALVLDDARRVVGTVADGDIRRALIRGEGLEVGVDRVMSRDFRSVLDDGNHRARAMELMVAHRIKQVPVLDGEGRLRGLHLMEEYFEPDPLPNWAVILAGGKGTRLRPITEHIPKPMVRVAGRPILERLVLGLVGEGVRHVFLAVNYMKEVIIDHFGDGSAFGCRIRYLEEDRPLGTGGPLALLPDTPRDPVLLMNGDLVTEVSARRLVEQHETQGNDLTMGVGVHAYQVPFGVVDVDDGRVRGIREKPWQDWMVNQGIYVLSPELVTRVPADREYPVTELIAQAVNEGLRVGAADVGGDWLDVGRPSDLAAARGASS